MKISYNQVINFKWYRYIIPKLITIENPLIYQWLLWQISFNKRKLGWIMISIAFFPQALGLLLLAGVSLWRTIIITLISQTLFVWGVEFLLGDLEKENKKLKQSNTIVNRSISEKNGD